MNAWLTAFDGWQPIVDAPVWVWLLLKITAILLAAWLVHLAIARANPRWRVVLWRVTAVGLIVLPAIAWLLPGLEIRVLKPPPAKEVATVSPVPKVLLDNRAVASHISSENSSNLLDPRAANLWPMSLSNPPEALVSSVETRSTLPQPEMPDPAAPQSPGIAWSTLLLASWLGGIVVLGFRCCLGHYWIWRMARGAKPATKWVCGECIRVAKAIGCRSRVEAAQSKAVESPFLCGLRRPLLLLPARMCETSYRKDLPGILAHELTHVRSHDVYWNAGLQLISIVLWFHPMTWRMRKAHLAACELVSDAVSANFVGDVTGYCRTLARVAVDVHASLPAAGIAMARTSAISRRLSTLRKKVFLMPLRRRSVLCFGLSALLAITLIGAMQLAMASPPEPEPIALADQAKPEEKVEQPPKEEKKTETAEKKEAKNSKPLEAPTKKGEEKSTGRIVDVKGVGIANATIEPDVNMPPLRESEDTPPMLVQKDDRPKWTATTDAQGRYTLPSLKSGTRYESIKISAPGFLGMDFFRSENGPLRDFTLERASTISGRILGTDGKPLANAPLAMGIYSNSAPQSADYLHAISDAKGEFKIENVPPGFAVVYYPGKEPIPYELQQGRETKLLAPGQKWPEPSVKDVVGSLLVELKDGEQAKDRVIDLSQSTCVLEGQVFGPDGKPLSDATVSLKRSCHNLSYNNLGVQLHGGDVRATSDKEGRFKLEHLPQGKWAISVWHPNFQRPGKIEYIDFASSGQKITHDLKVFERYEDENVFPPRMTIEHAESLKDLPSQGRFMFETPTNAQYQGLPRRYSYSFAELTVNSVPMARIDIEKLNLPEDATPEQIAKGANVGELYYMKPDTLVTVNGTVLVPCVFPEKNSADETQLSRLSRLTRAELEEHVKASLRETPQADGFRVKFKKGDWFIAVRNDGRAFVVIIEVDHPSLSDYFVRLGTYYLGQLAVRKEKVDLPDVLKPAGEITAPPNQTDSSPVEKESKPAGAPSVLAPSAYSERISVVDDAGKPIPEGNLKIETKEGVLVTKSITVNEPAGSVGVVGTQGPKNSSKAPAGPKTDSPKSAKPGLRTIKIQVLDPQKKPIEKAGIIVRYSTNLFFGPIHYPTDAEGIASVEIPKEKVKDFQILAMLDGYVTAGAVWKGEAVDAVIPETYTFNLESGTIFGGTVRDEEGKPIAGAEVTVDGRKTLPDNPLWISIYDTVKTDAEGKWKVHRVPKDLDGFDLDVKLKRLDLAGVERFERKALSIEKLRDQTAVFVMRRGITVEGTVTDPQGKPAVGATVGLFEEYSRGDFPRTKTDKDGHYRFAVTEPGEYTLAAAAKDYAPDSRRVKLGKQPQIVDLQLDEGEMIRLRVVDKEGKPMQGVTVATVFNNKYREALMLDYETTFERDHYRHRLADAEGRWTRLWIPRDELTLLISKPGYAQVEKKFLPGEKEQVVTLEAGVWTVSGRVVDQETKVPVTKFRVTEGRSGSGFGDQTSWYESHFVENEKGEYAATWDRAEERRMIRIEADGYYPSNVAGPLKEKVEKFNVELKKGQNVAGVVLSPDAKPLADVDVVLCTPGRGLYLRNGRPGLDQHPCIVRTASDGRFSFPPQSEPFRLVAMHDRGFAEVKDSADMKQITLQPWARVEGTLTVDRKPGVKEHIRINFDDPWAQRISDYKVQTDDQGHFVFDRVRPGNAKISRHIKVSQEGMMSSWKDTDSQPVEFIPGKTLKVDINSEPDSANSNNQAGG